MKTFKGSEDLKTSISESDLFAQQLQALVQKWQLHKVESIQSLWSGYGEIARYHSETLNQSVIIKQVSPQSRSSHPRGWNTSLSHERKVFSYQAELNFYRHYAPVFLDSQACPIPKLLDHIQQGDELALLLEDIDAAGFSLRKTHLSVEKIKHCLSWLAQFHGAFLNVKPEGLWRTGCYWHLNTRPDEYEAMPESSLKHHARDIDERLHNARFTTLVHGDAKLANFCFSAAPLNPSTVAALDFQYVGAGPGIKDVMLFLGSCLDAQALFDHEQELLHHYFSTLHKAVVQANPQLEFTQLEEEWRDLYCFAWADFHRFLTGWKPDHFKINAYMQAQTQMCLDLIR